MSDSSNLQRISEAALKRIEEKRTEHASAMKLAQEELSKHSSAILSGTLDKLTTICESSLWEASSLKALTEEGFGKTYQMLEDDLDATSLRATADLELKMSLSRQSIERLRTACLEVVAECEFVRKELVELTRDGAAASLMMSSPGVSRFLAGHQKLSSEELVGLLSKLLQIEQQLSQRVGAVVMEMLSGWQRELELELGSIRDAVRANSLLAVDAEQGLQTAAREFGQNALSQIDAKVESLEAEMCDGFLRIQESTAGFMAECSRRTTAELEQVLIYADGRRSRGEERLRQTLDDNNNALKQAVEKQDEESRTKLKTLVGASADEASRFLERFAGLEQRAVSEGDETVADLFKQFQRATAEFEAQLNVISDRGVKQLNVLMDESEGALKNLSTSVVDRFHKSNQEYVELLDISHTDIKVQLDDAKNKCLTLIDSLSSSLKQTESHS